VSYVSYNRENSKLNQSLVQNQNNKNENIKSNFFYQADDSFIGFNTKNIITEADTKTAPLLYLSVLKN
jgi:hypothetical protein